MVLTLTGKLRRSGYRDKQNEYNQLMRIIGLETDPRMLFDFSECRLLDSVTVGVLIGLTQAAIRNGGQVGLCNLPAAVSETLSQLLLLEPKHRQLSWKVYPDIERAVAQMISGAPVASSVPDLV